MISVSSVLCALVLFTAAQAFVCQLSQQTQFLEKRDVSILLLVSTAATVRLLLPIEIPITYAVRSWAVLGTVQRFFREHPAIQLILVTVWAAGALVTVGRDAAALCCAHKRCRSYVPVEDELVQEAARRLRVKCPVVVTPDVDVPFVAGFFQHTIYFPAEGLEESEIELALLHELQHIRNHDGPIKLFVGLLTAAMWWNPVASKLRLAAVRLLELRCDAKVAKRLSLQEQHEYLDMLQRLALLVLAKRSAPVPVLDESPAVRKDPLIVQRFRVAIARQRRPPRRLRSVAQFMLLLVLFCASYLLIVQPAELAPAENFQNDSRTVYEEEYEGPDNYMGMYDTFVVKGSDGRYQLFVNYEFKRYLSEDEITSDKYIDLYLFKEDRKP